MFCSTLVAMAEDLIWFSTQLLHSYVPGICVRMWWQEERKTEVRGTSASPSPAITQGAFGASPKWGSHCWGSSSDEDERYSRSRFATPRVSSSSQPIRTLMSGSRLRQKSSFLLAFRRFQIPMQIAVWLRFAQLIVRCDFALMRPSRPTATTTRIGKTHGTVAIHALQADVPPSFLTFTTTASLLPSSWTSCPAGLPALL